MPFSRLVVSMEFEVSFKILIQATKYENAE
jgi:hypothetical protein